MGSGSSDQKRVLTASQPSKKSRGEEQINDLFKEKLSLQDFQVLNNHIGEGGFATVMKVKYTKNGELYACKVLSKKQLLQERQVVNIFTERGILIRLRHPFIVSLQYAFQTEENLFFVMDYCPGGDFFHYLQQKSKFPERVTRFYAAEICLALEAIHNCDIIHRDLKPENILITKDGHLKITDFGLSKWGGGRTKKTLRAQTFLGSAPYLAPEILENQEYTKAVDWWAFGILITEMLTGLPAFYESNTENNYKRILHESVAFKSYISRDARSIILDLLEKDPKHRLKGSAEVKRHEFFRTTDFEAILNLTAPIPPEVGCSKREEDSDSEPSSSVENIGDYFGDGNKKGDDLPPIDPTKPITADPFMGFSYQPAKNASLLSGPLDEPAFPVHNQAATTFETS